MHRPELDQVERHPVEPGALLDEEHRAARVELDRERDHQHHGRQHDQAGDRHEQTERPLEHGLHARRRELGREDEATRRHELEGELAGQALVRLHDVLDLDTARAGLDQTGERHAPTPVREPDDDAIRPPRRDHPFEVDPVLDHADELVSTGMPRELFDDPARERARADDEQPLADTAKVPHTAVGARADQKRHDQEARVQRALAEPNLRKEMVSHRHHVHTTAATRDVRAVSRRRIARSQRTGPSLSGSCRTTGPSSRRSARTVTGPGSMKSASTGRAPPEA